MSSPATCSPTREPLAPRACGDRDLPARLRRAEEPVIVEGYFGGWETPWRGLSSEAWREIHAALGGRASGIAVETGANREFAARHGIEVIPAVLVFSDGEVVARFSGRVRPAQVIEAVQSARKRAQRTAADLRELAAIETTEEQRSPVRSILRRRSQEPELLARAG